MKCLLVYLVSVLLVLIAAMVATVAALPVSVQQQQQQNEEEQSQTKVLRRVKRQYFKPSIDGNILGSERKVTPLKSTKTLTSNSLGSFVGDPLSTNSASNDSLMSASSSNTSSAAAAAASIGVMKYNEITVTSLALSLINLFDRIKITLCDIVGQSCHQQMQQQQQQPPSSPPPQLQQG